MKFCRIFVTASVGQYTHEIFNKVLGTYLYGKEQVSDLFAEISSLRAL